MSNAITNECPACDTGTLAVYATRVDETTSLRIRYRKCRTCGYTPDSPQIVPLSAAPMQSSRRITKRRIGINRLL